MVPGKRMLQG